MEEKEEQAADGNNNGPLEEVFSVAPPSTATGGARGAVLGALRGPRTLLGELEGDGGGGGVARVTPLDPDVCLALSALEPLPRLVDRHAWFQAFLDGGGSGGGGGRTAPGGRAARWRPRRGVKRARVHGEEEQEEEEEEEEERGGEGGGEKRARTTTTTSEEGREMEARFGRAVQDLMWMGFVRPASGKNGSERLVRTVFNVLPQG